MRWSATNRSERARFRTWAQFGLSTQSTPAPAFLRSLSAVAWTPQTERQGLSHVNDLRGR